ncbi:MAG: hypothetical protein AAF761_01305 [Pseudomonadota bacterium]
MSGDLSRAHVRLEGAPETRRYFAKFEQIMGHLDHVARMIMDDGDITRSEGRIVRDYLRRLTHTFRALSHKYLMTTRVAGAPGRGMAVDRLDSGFPTFQELLTMANDAMNAPRHLAALPEPRQIKEDMVRHILNSRTHPTRLQFAMAQRLYFEELIGQDIFWSANDPMAAWRGEAPQRRRKYQIHWAVFDTQTNLPAIYVMDVEEDGWNALPTDEKRWPAVQSHLMAQAISGLKLLTIADGFDQDFDDIFPKKLRRIQVGPMYSHAYTQQSGPLRDILAEARGEAGLDWALEWRVETLVSRDERTESTGWFSKAPRQIFDLVEPQDMGLSDRRRALVLPQRAYQVLNEHNPESLRGVRRYVVHTSGRVARYG